MTNIKYKSVRENADLKLAIIILNILHELYAMKVARTVLGGKQFREDFIPQQTLCSFTVV